MNKTDFWICDRCGKKIEDIKDGWVEWMTFRDASQNNEYKNKQMRIVHRVDCLYTDKELASNNAIASDDDLEHFAGADGLMTLLSYISDDEFVDRENVLEVIKRIHIPGYEVARLHFDEGIANQVFEPNTKPNYYSQHDIQQVLKYLRGK